ncbi:hypothetical protein JVT61DRAFT_6765 [Boletus reticuloceps]|uniref:Uncharacterized protein n=1 Tax=Boletus reticuloceps TaxID=495285 RepID=A0A8I2YJA5_9AGAM|nr:hypothetical protein JVT61DRAFT_6765 [Boletus reticuloceps]
MTLPNTQLRTVLTSPSVTSNLSIELCTQAQHKLSVARQYYVGFSWVIPCSQHELFLVSDEDIRSVSDRSDDFDPSGITIGFISAAAAAWGCSCRRMSSYKHCPWNYQVVPAANFPIKSFRNAHMLFNNPNASHFGKYTELDHYYLECNRVTALPSGERNLCLMTIPIT